MFFDGYIGAPPTITVFSPDISLFIIFLSSALAGASAMPVMARVENATADSNAMRLDMDRLPVDQGRAGDAAPARREGLSRTTNPRSRIASSMSQLRKLFG